MFSAHSGGGQHGKRLASQDRPPPCVSPKTQLRVAKPNVPTAPRIPSSPALDFLTLGLAHRFVATLLKAILDHLAFFFSFFLSFQSSVFLRDLQCKISPCPCHNWKHLKGDPPGQLLQVPGVSWTTHCFSPAVMRCHSFSTSCPISRVLTRSETAPAMQSRTPQPGPECPHFSLETLSPLQICSQSEEGNREPLGSHTRTVHPASLRASLLGLQPLEMPSGH